MSDTELRRVLLLGGEDSGRQTLLVPLVTGRPYAPGDPLQLPNYRRTITTADGRTVDLEFMVATTRHFRYRMLEYARADAILLCFAVDEPGAFHKATRGHWLWEVRTNVDPDVPVFLVANKADKRHSSSSSTRRADDDDDDEGRASDDDNSTSSDDERMTAESSDEGRASDYDDQAARTHPFVSVDQGHRALFNSESRITKYFECSAYTKEGVDELLTALTDPPVEPPPLQWVPHANDLLQEIYK